MFDFFRTKGIPDEELVSVSMPIVIEFRSTFNKLPDVETWYVIYRRLFEEGFLSGYICGASEIIAEKACDDFNVKKDFIYRYINKTRVCKCVIGELFGDTAHAQQHRDMLAQLTSKKKKTDIYIDGLQCGAADARELTLNGECSHHLKKVLNILDYEEMHLHVPLLSLIEVLKENPLPLLAHNEAVEKL